jgi:hypothetical protein
MAEFCRVSKQLLHDAPPAKGHDQLAASDPVTHRTAPDVG